ncbi:ATP synthase subunit I [Arenimonas caeni]|uniref:ATP synthase subunit I n=1 Tax=Arenimonas caeni TaxID=2058085 RepID=UPI0013B05EEC|nr:ATP synthase subunit I [Arenimonas caeni]
MSRIPVAGPRLARKTALAQMVTGMVVAGAAGLMSGPKAAAAAALGAVAIVLGSLLLARALVGGGVHSATGALGRLLLGMVGKWVLVAAVFVLAIGILKLPVLPLIAGLAAAVVASMVAAARAS